jgi:hypothetical protein
MTTPSAAHLTLAARLCEHECGNVRTSPNCAAAAVRVFEKLFTQLAPLVGTSGTLAVFARSITLAKRDVPALANVVAEGAPRDVATSLFDGLSALPPNEALSGAARLYATLFTLMTTFIGGALLRQMLMAAWPTVDINVEETP